VRSSPGSCAARLAMPASSNGNGTMYLILIV
jgi:hypothetical protein